MKTPSYHPGWIDALSDNYTIFQRNLAPIRPVEAAAETSHEQREMTLVSVVGTVVACALFVLMLG